MGSKKLKEVYRRSEQQEEEQDPGRTSEEEFRSHRRLREQALTH